MQAHYDARETRPADERERLLFERLPAALEQARAGAPAIARQLQGIDPAVLDSRKALTRVPVLRKSELLQAQHAARISPAGTTAEADRQRVFGGFSTIDWGEARRVFASPGPIYEPEGPRPDYWGFARALHAAGVRPGMLVHNCFSYHFTPAGSMMETAAHALGCTVFPGGVGQTEQQVRAMADLAPHAYTGTPSFLRIILEKADEMGVVLPSLQRALFSGEAYPPSLQAWFQMRGIQGFQAYGSADLGMVAYETSAREGLVVNEDLILEIVRPGTGQPVPDGEVGELVVTTLNADYPLLRFGTGDLSALMPGASPCGRTNLRIRGWLGRADQTTKVRGMFVHPEQIARVLDRHAGIGRARLVVSGESGHDVMTLRIEADAALDTEAVAATVREQTKLRAVIEIVAAGSLPNDGKVIEDARRYD
ncbi:phenylacetate--CoA ligase family protein [Castellaniella defragrans]|uniref:phenylacetate--CoA ligase family protein n=1 Tax=Castellaniella defragrans TaxID=75697 RepID=UPI0023F48932|nr:AMP-binding protein [Castellaniella defragrans]